MQLSATPAREVLWDGEAVIAYQYICSPEKIQNESTGLPSKSA